MVRETKTINAVYEKIGFAENFCSLISFGTHGGPAGRLAGLLWGLQVTAQWAGATGPWRGLGAGQAEGAGGLPSGLVSAGA